MVRIVCGDPEQDQENCQGATSSTFVLPFRYRLQPSEVCRVDGLCYREITPGSCDEQWVERRRYYTRETAEVLFYHARRFRIDAADWRDSPRIPNHYLFCTHERETDAESSKLVARLEPPEIVLFDARIDAAIGSQDTELLHTGFLVLRVYFDTESCDAKEKTPSFNDLLAFNERFRYWRPRYASHYKDELKSFFPGLGDGSEDSALDFFLRRWQSLLLLPFRFADFNPGRCYRFFDPAWTQEAERWLREENDEGCGTSKQSGWIAYSDNRCFLWTHAMTKHGLDDLQAFATENLVEKPQAAGHWVKLLNADMPGENDESTAITTSFERDWALPRIYRRWAHWGSVYGFNYHSGASITPARDFPLSRTFRRHYFDMILLLLYIRVSIFRISGRLSLLTGRMHSMKPEKAEKEFLVLRREFAYFTNLYQFPLVSNQQQMLEMYQIARKQMDLDDLYKEVEEEIQNTHEYFSIENANRLNRILYWVAWVGLVLGLLGVLLTAIPLENLMCLIDRNSPCFP